MKTIVFMLLILSVHNVSGEELTAELVYDCCVRKNLKFPEIVTAQSVLETGWYNSNVCKSKNNIFGIKGKNGYKKFKHWKEGVVYYRERIQNRYRSGEDYYGFLSRIGYATDTLYIQKVKLIVNKYSKHWVDG